MSLYWLSQGLKSKTVVLTRSGTKNGFHKGDLPKSKLIK